MDPEATLIEQLELAGAITKIWDECPEDGEFTTDQAQELAGHAIRLSELVLAMNEWLSKGGSLPRQWVGGPPDAFDKLKG